MRLHELLPGARPFTLRRWLDAGFGQDVLDRGAADFDAESCAQGVSDFRIAPGWIFHRKLDDELADVLGLGWTAASGGGAVEFPRGELAKPGENRLGPDQPAAFPTLVRGERLAGGSETAALVGGEGDLLAARDSVELFLENAPLFFDVVELALQTIVDRGGDRHDNELQRHGQHRWPDCSHVPAFPRSLRQRFCARISAILFWTSRGHKDIKTTMRYAHLSPNMGQDAVALLDNNASYEATTRQQNEN
jgi:hypothetical protein